MLVALCAAELTIAAWTSAFAFLSRACTIANSASAFARMSRLSARWLSPSDMAFWARAICSLASLSESWDAGSLLAPSSRALRSADCASASRCVGGGRLAPHAQNTGATIATEIIDLDILVFPSHDASHRARSVSLGKRHRESGLPHVA